MKYRGLPVALLSALLLVCMGAESEWLRVKSSNFEILSSVGAQETRRVAEHLELANGFFAKILGAEPPQSEPIRVVIFRSRKEYERHSSLEASVAHYARISGRDYLAIRTADDGVLPSAIHELFHASARRTGWNLPVWLDEGLAEVYSTLRYSDGKLFAGATVASRRAQMRIGDWTSVANILETTYASADYNQPGRRGAFYNGSWALAHMLVFEQGYASEFPSVMDRLRNGESAKAVLEDVYRKPLTAIEIDLTNYVKYGRLREKPFGEARGGVGKSFEINRAPAFDVALAMIDLNNRQGADRDARSALERLAAANPDRPEPWVSLGYLALRHDLLGEMDGFFSRAVDLGSRNPTMLWEYANVGGRANPASAARALARLIEMRPGDQPALLLLAEIQAQMRQFRAALQTLAAYGDVRTEDRLHYYRTAAISKSEIDDRAGARAAAQRWYELAMDIEDRDKADRVLKYLDSMDAIDNNARASLVETGEPKVEVIDSGPAPVIRPSVGGQLVSFDCKREPSQLVLLTPLGRSVFLVDDFDKLTVYGLRGKSFEITCGPQKPVEVRIQYDPPAAGQKGVLGLARAIHFEPEPEQIP